MKFLFASLAAVILGFTADLVFGDPPGFIPSA